MISKTTFFCMRCQKKVLASKLQYKLMRNEPMLFGTCLECKKPVSIMLSVRLLLGASNEKG